MTIKKVWNEYTSPHNYKKAVDIDKFLVRQNKLSNQRAWRKS